MDGLKYRPITQTDKQRLNEIRARTVAIIESKMVPSTLLDDTLELIGWVRRLEGEIGLIRNETLKRCSDIAERYVGDEDCGSVCACISDEILGLADSATAEPVE